mmetsp:Transcript_39726/g.97825  ORF Transcript_39726/g.97825 Transcript_39726/m.97825 type:complete len:262 (+) Transcript_39726:1382-2167(+)
MALRVHFLLLEFGLFRAELVKHLVQHVNDSLRVRLIGVGLRDTLLFLHEVLCILRIVSQEGLDSAAGGVGDRLLRSELEQKGALLDGLCLLQGVEHPLHSIDGFCRLLLCGKELLVLFLTIFLGLLLLGSPLIDLLGVLLDLSPELPDPRIQLRDLSFQFGNLLGRLFDGGGSRFLSVLAELRKSCKFYLLVLHLRLALVRHVVQKLDDLLHSTLLPSGGRCRHARKNSADSHVASSKTARRLPRSQHAATRTRRGKEASL